MGYHTNTGLRPKALYMIQDTTTNGANAGRMLEDESSTGKKRPWRKQKMGSRAIAASLYRCWKKHPRKNAALKKRSDWMQQCGNYLVFGDVVNPETGEVARKLQAAQFCRDRLCPMCREWKPLLQASQKASERSGRLEAMEAEKRSLEARLKALEGELATSQARLRTATAEQKAVTCSHPPCNFAARGGGFSLKATDVASIDELSPCAPRFRFL